MSTLLQRYSFNGTLTGEGSLNLALQNTSTTLGTPSYTTGPTAGTQALVIGATTYLDLPYNASLNFTNSNAPWSFGGWFYTTSNSAGYLSNQAGPSGDGIELSNYSNNTAPNVIANKGNTTGVSNAASRTLNCSAGGLPSETSIWTHILIIATSSTSITLYVNGVLKASSTISGDFSSPTPWSIVKLSTQSCGKFTGAIADIRWYSGIIDPSVAMTQIPVLLQQFTFNGTLVGTGSLALAPVNSSTTLGTPTYTAGPVVGSQALVIPYATSYLVLPYNAALDFSNTFDYSFGGWFYANTGNNQNFVLSNHGTNDYSGYGFEISLSTNGPYGNIWSSSAKYFNGGGPNLVGTWVHLWVVKSANTLTIYYNGTASTTTVDLTNFPTASSLGWQINGPRGAIAAGVKVYDVRWYSGVVTPTTAMQPTAPVPLQQLLFNNSLVGTGSLALTVAYSTTGSDTVTYIAGPSSGLKALNLTSTNLLTLPYSASLNFNYNISFSFGGWFYISSTPYVGMYMCNTGISKSQGVELYQFATTSGIGVSIYQSSARVLSEIGSQSSVINSWHHIWLTYDGSTAKTYRNGVLIGSVVVTSGYNFSSTQSWQINSQPVVGAVSDLRWYSGVISPAVAQAATGSVIPSVPIITTITSTNTTSNTGTATVTATGGNGTFSYSWTQDGSSIAATTAAITGLVPGYYSCTVASGSATSVVSNVYISYITGINVAVLDGSYAKYLSTVSTVPLPSAFTVELWAYSTNLSNYGRLIEVYSSFGSVNFEICLNPGTGYLYTNITGSVATIPATTIALNTWTHFACTISATGKFTLYRNGSQVYQSNVTPFNAGSYYCMFGRSVYNGDTGSSWNGRFAEMRVWNVERTASQISIGYKTSYNTPPDNTLVVNISSNALNSISGTGAISASASIVSTTFYGYTNSIIVNDTILGPILNSLLPNAWFSVNSCTTSTVQSKFGGRSLFIDGNNAQYATFALDSSFNANTSDWTFEMWSYNTSLNSSSTLYGTTNGIAAIWSSFTGIINNNINWTTAVNAITYNINYNSNLGHDLGLAYNPNSWDHIALCYSASAKTFTAFVNGIKATTLSSIGWSDPSLFSHIALGARPDIQAANSNLQMMEGYIDELRISNSVRYTVNFTPSSIAFLEDSNTLLLNHFNNSIIVGPIGTTVNWILDSNGFYNISSTNHLDMLMNQGTISGLVNTGNSPTNWWSSKYIQTANIIYTKLPTNIGNSSINFTGIYDGQQYQIQNLFYNVAGTYALFGNINNCTIKNVILGGSLNIYGTSSTNSIAVNYGGIVYTATNNCLIQNCQIQASGTINTTGSLSLICNNMSGQYGIIYKCLTNYIGNISSSTCGNILTSGGGISNTYVLFCTINNVGNQTVSGNFSTFFVHTGATLFGCLISSAGTFSSQTYNAAFTFDGNAIACVNAMNGNYNGGFYGGGITTTGSAESCIMAMNGNFISNTGGAICQTGTAYNCINIMKGTVSGSPAIGGNSTKNNICAMNGTTDTPYLATRDEYCILDYGFSNSTANFPVINDIWNRFNTSNYYTYYNEINFPILKPNLSYSVNNSNFAGPAPLWQIPFPNLSSQYTTFKYQYNYTNSNYDIVTQNINSSNINIQTALLADGTNSNILPYYLIDFSKGYTSKAVFKSNLDSIIQNNSNISNIVEASFYNNLSNQTNSYYDANSFSNSVLPNITIFKPAFKKILNLLVPDNIIIKNLSNKSLCSNVIKSRNIDKLYISSNTTISSLQRDSLFSNNLDILLFDNKSYTINIDATQCNALININTTNSLSNFVTYNFNNSNSILNSNNPIVEYQYNSNIFKAFELTATNPTSIMLYNLTNVTYTIDSNNYYQIPYYQIPSTDHFLCFFYQGYRYHKSNAPPNYLTANYKQLSNLNFSNTSNLMLNSTFSGLYDGNNFEIQNLFYSTSDFSKVTNFSLFNSINNATIQNVTLGGTLNVYDTRGSNIVGNINYGGLIYTANNNCLIKNCKINSTGIININGTHSLICNGMTGQYGIITNCVTNFIGPINCSYCGNILYNGAGDTSSYVLFSTVNNTGTTTCFRDSGIVSHGSATIFGCLISMTGDFNCSIYNGGFSYSSPVIASINSMIGNYNIGVYGGAIIGVGTADYCINSMIGTVNSSGNNNGGAIAHTGTVRNCLNIMKGQVNGYVFGSSGANSNNVSAMFGNVTTFANTIAQYAVLDYGFSNTNAQLTVTAGSNVKNILVSSSSNQNSYYKYNPNFDLPYLPQLIYTVNNSNFIGPAPLWNNTYPNIAGNPLITPQYNYYAIRGSDELLTKLYISNFTTSNIDSAISLYNINQISNNSSNNTSNIPINPLSIILNPQNPLKIITDKNNKKFLLKLNGINNNSTLSGASLSITQILDVNFSSNQSNQYLIQDSNQFLCLMAQGNSNYYNITNSQPPSFSNGSFIQTADLNLINEINPIMYNQFYGIYDGNAFQIQNLNINEDLISNTTTNTGLFASISNATIKNINITGITNIVNNSNDYRTSGCDFGFISGYAENSLISDCTINTTLSNVKCMSFGGIVRKAKNSVIIRNNFNVKGNIQINDKYAGGIVASAENTKILFNTNSMIGNINTINNVVGGIYGGFSNGANYIYGNINLMRGNIISDYLLNSIGGIQGMTGSNDNIQVNINALFGDILSGSDKNGAIVGDAINQSTIRYNINAQKGNINGSGIVDSVGAMTTVTNNVNTMRGLCTQAAGIKYIDNNNLRIQHNLVIMNGDALVKESVISSAIAFTQFGFSNSHNMETASTPQNVIFPDNFFKYYNDTSFCNLPIPTFSSVSNVIIDSKTYNGPAPYWGAYFPNISDSNYIYYVFTSNNLIMPLNIINTGNSLIKVKII